LRPPEPALSGFSPLTGIRIPQTVTLQIAGAMIALGFSPLTGIRIPQTRCRDVQVEGRLAGFSPLTGIRIPQTSSPCFSSSPGWLFQSPDGDSDSSDGPPNAGCGPDPQSFQSPDGDSDSSDFKDGMFSARPEIVRFSPLTGIRIPQTFVRVASSRSPETCFSPLTGIRIPQTKGEKRMKIMAILAVSVP